MDNLETNNLLIDDIDNLETGDLLLFTEKGSGLFGFFLNMIKWATHSDYVHVAMVLKDPTFINPNLKGMYVWESSWEGKPDPQDGKIKLGVQITPLQEILDAYKKNGHVFIRKLTAPKEKFDINKLTEVHNVVYNKPYDIVPTDWIEALLQKDLSPQKNSRFWCSALVGYIYTKCDILIPSTDWSIMRPSDFAITRENLRFVNGCYLANKIIKIQ